MVQNCIFDLYGTLVDIHTDEERPALWRAMAAWYTGRGAAYGPAELWTTYLRLVHKRLRNTGARYAHEGYPELQIGEIFLELFRHKGVPAAPQDAAEAALTFRRLSTDRLRLYPGARELLTGLRAQGRGVWLLSNAQRLFTARELDDLGLTDLFDGIYLSSDYGCKKPDPRFYRVLLEERGIDPAAAVMVGNDAACDIRGAQAVGLRTLYIRSNLSPREPLPAADHVLEQMDLPRVGRLLIQ